MSKELETKKDNLEVIKPEVFKKGEPLPKRMVTKKNRVPFGKKKTLAVDAKLTKGYHSHWVTDESGRIERAIAAGYDFTQSTNIEDDRNAQDPSRFGNVMRKSVGNGKYGYFMRVPQDWWDEDQKNKHKELDERDIAVGFDQLPHEYRHCFRGKIDIKDSSK